MKRREFIRTTSAASVAAASAIVFGNLKTLFSQTTHVYDNESFDMAAVMNGEPGIMFDKAIESLGGMEAFVKKGQTVVVKPNIGWDAIPERAANSNPELIKRIVEKSYEAGASEVYVFDYTCDEWRNCYENSLIEPLAKEAGAKVVPGNFEKYYRPVEIPNGVSLKEAKVHELILDSDVFINVPVLKHHSSADLSIAMKNLMGIIWDRRWWHRNNLHQCIADFTTFCKPDLNVIDAYRVMMKNGPRGVSEKDVVTYKTQIISKDIVAADAAAAKVFGSDPASVGYIKKASDMGVGTMDLDKLNIDRIRLN
jgi:uncharacterized protein (DUF362 family)